MIVCSNYGKKEVEKKSRNLLIVSLLTQSILLIIITVLVVSFVSINTEKGINEQLDLVYASAKEGLFLDNHINPAVLFPDCTIVYYYDNGKNINAKPGFAEYYDPLLDGQDVTVDKVQYRIKTGDMDNKGSDAKHFIIYRDLSRDRERYYTIIWLAISLFAVIFAALALISFWIIQWQIKYYEHAVAVNNQLVSDISHEFNTPLAIIKASLGKILSEPDCKVEDVSESLVTVTHEAGRLNRMVRDMLILSRSDSERLILEMKNCNISKIVEDVVEPFNLMCELQNKTMHIEIQENVLSRMDEDKLRQSLIILLDNAVKYTAEGDSISVILKEGYTRYTITVADTGIGVAKEDLQHIFERFYRTDASRSLETGGSGLGLSIVKVIADALKGKVMAYQNKPKGFKVVLELPKEKFTQILQNNLQE